MLGKLLKYDLKWIYKALIPFYIFSIIFAIFYRIFNSIEDSFIMMIIAKICSGTVIAMIINILINCLMRVWARVNKNFYKDESYLTHTLPIKKGTIYLSKFLAAVITLFTSILLILGVVFIAYYTEANFELLKLSLNTIADIYESSVNELLISMVIVLFLELLFGMQSGILGLIIGNKFNDKKIILSIFFGFALYLIASATSLLIIFLIGLVNENVMTLFNSMANLSIDAVKLVLIGGMIMYTFYIVLYYFIGLKLLKKGVNVE